MSGGKLKSLFMYVLWEMTKFLKMRKVVYMLPVGNEEVCSYACGWK